MRSEHPLFKVPAEFWAQVPPESYSECLWTWDEAQRNALVYTAPNRAMGWQFDDGYGDEVAMEDMLFKYRPTPEEIARGLQGPPGPVGPIGAQGEPGNPAPFPEEGTDDYRLAALESTVQTIARQVTDLMHTVNNQKEK